MCPVRGRPEHGQCKGPRHLPQALDTSRLNPEWSLSSLLDQNPLVWMAEVNGVFNLRDMPREVQQIAFDDRVR